MDQLPDDVIKFILGYVCNIDVLSFSLTSKENKRAYSQFFYQRFVNDFDKLNKIVLSENIMMSGPILNNCLNGNAYQGSCTFFHPSSMTRYYYLIDLFEKLKFNPGLTVYDIKHYKGPKGVTYYVKPPTIFNNEPLSYCGKVLTIRNPFRFINENKVMVETLDSVRKEQRRKERVRREKKKI